MQKMSRNGHRKCSTCDIQSLQNKGIAQCFLLLSEEDLAQMQSLMKLWCGFDQVLKSSFQEYHQRYHFDGVHRLCLSDLAWNYQGKTSFVQCLLNYEPAVIHLQK